MNGKTYVIVRHAPGQQTIVAQGPRKAVLEHKKLGRHYHDRKALFFEVRQATEQDNLSDVPTVAMQQQTAILR
jgi:hypothetical protein